MPDRVLAPLLPDGIRACLFDVDGVLTQTARVHAAAWKEMFDGFLRERADETKEPFRPFELPRDYLDHVDGKLRQDGVRAFLASRGIELPEGGAGDPPRALTVHGLGTRKNDLVLELLRRDGVEPYPDALPFVDGVVAAELGLRGKPAPDMFLAAAEALGVSPAHAAVFEDAEAGVQAGRAGAFGFVVGVDRTGNAAALLAHGADTVVADLRELLARP
jgi:beta-phosphoglucomutase-like phosphatase (HAD superfamily)